MEMNEIRAALPNCPRCGRHCPINQTSCPRGQELVAKLQSGEMTLAEATAAAGSPGKETHGGHGHPHGGHGHHHHDHASEEDKA